MTYFKKILQSAALAAMTMGGGATAETPENVLVIATIMDDAITFDPAESFETTPSEIILNTYDTLVRYEPEDLTKLVGAAADSWTVSEDGKVFVFKLKPGMTFTSGNPVTAADVVFSFARVLKADKTPAFLFKQFGWSADNVDSMLSAVDDLTFEMKITADFAPSLVLNVLTSANGSIVDAKTVLANDVDGDLGLAYLKSKSEGSGAFELVSWQPNQSIVLQANPTYRRGSPDMERVILRHVSETASQRLLLEKGDVDIARNLPGDAINALEGNDEITVLRTLSGRNLYIGMSQKFEPFTDPKVREAMKYLVRYEAMTDSFLKGGYTVLQSYWPNEFYAALEETPFSYDVEKAKALLAEAGYVDGFSFKLNVRNTSPAIDIAQAVQQSMSVAGINVDIVQSDQKQFITSYRERQFEAILGTWAPVFPDPHSNTESFVRNIDNGPDSPVKSVAWRNSWKNDELTALADAASNEADEAKRIEMYKDLQRRVQQEGPYIGIVQETSQTALRNTVENFVKGPNMAYYELVSK